ncbi:MAG TPA: hypothetical protein VEQ41_05540 [Solirubrobacterales bacterium]|nr:hypothetical protein [Solirubrobacterales bacterium]
MPLSDDQRKLLKLLANQDEAYEAIAAATGASVGDLKAKAREALAALDEEAREAGRQDRSVRDEGGRPAGPVAAGDPPPLPVAKASSGEVPPSAPPAGDAARRPGSRPRTRSQARSSVSLPGNRRLAELIGGAVVVLLLILFATGAIDIGGDDSDDGGDGGNTPAFGGELPAAVAKRATQAILRPVGDGDASGRALFGRLEKQVALVLAAKGLEPTTAGQSYAVSLVNAEGERIPIAATRVGSNGAIATQIEVPPTVLGALASGYDEMEISLVVNEELEAALKQARGEESAPDFGGEPVLRGEVTGPVVVGAPGAGG